MVRVNVVQHLTISRNLFGSTYYTLVGFMPSCFVGIIVMLTVLGLTLSRLLTTSNAAVELVSWYWHCRLRVDRRVRRGLSADGDGSRTAISNPGSIPCQHSVNRFENQIL